MRRRAHSCLAVVLSLSLAASADAQHSDIVRLVQRPVPAFAGLSGAPLITRDAPATPAANEAKSPVAAGFLSLLVPGMGSFYAGNSQHGFVHVGIALGSAIVAKATCGQGHDSPCGGASDAAVVVSLVNWSWSILNAVRDARASGGASRQSRR